MAGYLQSRVPRPMIERIVLTLTMTVGEDDGDLTGMTEDGRC